MVTAAVGVLGHCPSLINRLVNFGEDSKKPQALRQIVSVWVSRGGRLSGLDVSALLIHEHA